MQAIWIHVPMHPPRRIGVEAPRLTVGRTPDNGLMLNDPAISRTHARFDWDEDGLWLRDLGSRHGTFVNGVRLQAPCQVKPGDEIRLGPLTLRLEPDVPTPPAPASLMRTVALADLRHSLEVADPGWHGALDLLHALSVDLVQDANPTAMVERLLQRLSTHLKARQGAALLRDMSGHIRILDRSGAEIQAPEGLTAEMVDAAFQRQEASLVLNPAETSGGSSTTSSMTVPLEHEGEVFGLLHFRSEAKHPFQQDDVRLVATLGNLLAARILHQRALDEIARRRNMERELEVREAATRTRAAFLATLSHELRSPLQALMGYHHLAQNERQPERIPEHLRKADQSGQLLMKLVTDILDFSKVDEGRLTLEAVPFRLQEVLETVEAMFRPQAEAKGLRLEWHLDAAVPTHLQGDPLRLGQVLINLVGNAVKFTSRGAVELAVTRPGDTNTLVFEVADTGIGLSVEEQAHIFEPYRQAGSHTARQFGGSGLGLAISRQLVALMGGQLSVQSTPGQGSLFRFDLLFQTASDMPEPQEPEQAFSGARILVVEDDVLNRELVMHVLNAAGLACQGAGTAMEALRLFRQSTFQAMVTDLTLPDFDGLELATRIRTLPRGGQLPMIALTGHDTSDAKARCLAAGFQGHLVKPVRPPALLELLRACLKECSIPRLEREDPALYAELVGIFLEEHAIAGAEIQNLLEQGCLQEAIDACHTVKGACLALEGTPAVEAWNALERTLRSGGAWEEALVPALQTHAALVAALQAREDLASR